MDRYEPENLWPAFKGPVCTNFKKAKCFKVTRLKAHLHFAVWSTSIKTGGARRHPTRSKSPAVLGVQRVGEPNYFISLQILTILSVSMGNLGKGIGKVSFYQFKNYKSSQTLNTGPLTVNSSWTSTSHWASKWSHQWCSSQKKVASTLTEGQFVAPLRRFSLFLYPPHCLNITLILLFSSNYSISLCLSSSPPSSE